MSSNGSAAGAATMAAVAAVAGGGGWPPFTMAQWQELEHQAMIFKYLKEGIPVPPELLAPIHRSLESMSGRFTHYPSLGYYSFYGKKIDPEPGRCRRTDGKKWRCSKDAHPDSKYCERHMNRGRYRSRKHVESKAASQSMSATKSDMSTGSCSGGISFQYLPQSTPASSFTIGFGSALSSPQVESTYRNLFKYSEMKQDATVRCVDANSVIGSTYSLSRATGERSSSGNSSPLDCRYPSLQNLQELDYSSCDMSKQNKQNTLIGMEFSPPEPAKQPVQDFFYEWSDPREKNFFMDNQSCDQGSFSSAQLSARPGKDPSELSSAHNPPIPNRSRIGDEGDGLGLPPPPSQGQDLSITVAAVSDQLLATPALFATPEFPSPKSTVIHAKTKSKFRETSANVANDKAPPPVSRKSKASPPARKEKQLNFIEDVKDFAFSQLEKLKRVLDLSHSAIVKDFDVSHACLQKRLKGRMQMCQEVVDEVDGKYKMVSEQMSENRKVMKATFAEFMQATPNSSHVCKVSIKELLHSFEKNLDALRQNFGIPSSK